MLRNKQVLRIAALLTITFAAGAVHSQSVDLGKLSDIKKKKLFTTGGNISASTIYYAGNGGIGREPLTYFLNGSLNLNVGGLVDLPFSFNLTNAGGGFQYPVAPNRLSLHPKYKAITGHVGDVNMFFSPYTLNDHPFRGAGVDFAPEKGGFKVSVMAGQLQRPVEYDSTNISVLAAYRRFGYGAKMKLDRKRYNIGMIVFAAKDQQNSLTFKPDSLQIFPKQNIVLSWNGVYTLAKDFEISAEYATSGITRDLRDTSAVTNNSKHLLKNFIKFSNSTSFYKALKTNLNYRYRNSTIGVGFERIDPGYETLGAYYFNNDFQNITVNFSQPVLKQKGYITGNVGMQTDNLDGKKIGSNQRTVVALNLSFIPNQQVFITTSYSNFTTFMNVKPYFQSINQVTQVQNFDTLNYSQVTNNANVNVSYIFNNKTKRIQSINANLSYLNAKDRQGGLLKFGSGSKFYNLSASYGISFVPEAITLTTAFNASYNKLAGSKNLIFGPTIAMRSKLLKTIATTILASYNSSRMDGRMDGKILNTQLNLSYSLTKKQQFSLNALNQLRNTNRGNFNDFVLTVGYNYNF